MSETNQDSLFFLSGTGAIAIGLATFFVMIFSVVFDRFVALKSLPDRRASWTVGLAFVASTLGVSLMLPGITAEIKGFPLWLDIFAAPLLPLPGAALNFYRYRSNYRRRWVESAEELPEGVGTENDNWLVGLGAIAAVIAIIVVRVAIRLAVRG